MSHTSAMKNVPRLVFSLVATLLFIVGMATPVSALSTQARQGATTTVKATVLHPRTATVPTAQTFYDQNTCDTCGMTPPTVAPSPNQVQQGGYLNNVPYYKHHLDQLGNKNLNGIGVYQQLERIHQINESMKARHGEGALPALIPNPSDEQIDAMKNESRTGNRAGLVHGVLGGLIGIVDPPVGVGIGTIGAIHCWSSLNIDACVQRIEKYQRIQAAQQAGHHK